MKKRILLHLCIALTTLTAFPACSNDENEWGIINKPIAENILGRWKVVKQTYKKDGEWIDLPMDDATLTMTFRSDGTVRGVYITASGRANLSGFNWSVNEEDSTFFFADSKCHILKLTEDELILDESTDDFETIGFYSRIADNPLTISERLVGRWILAQRYEKVDGKWIEITDNLPSEHWCEYTDVGNYTTYTRWPNGDERKSKETQWMMYEPEGVMAYGDMVAWEFSYFRLALEDDYTRMVMNYSENFDPELEEQTSTEYKDVLIREK